MSLKVRNIAVILLTDEDGKVLLQHRSDDAPSYAGQWGLFGGGIDEGESPDEAVLREAYEELRAELTNPTCFLHATFVSPLRQGTRSCYHQVWTDKSVLELHEGKDWGWFTIDEALALDIPVHIPEVLHELRSYLASKTE